MFLFIEITTIATLIVLYVLKKNVKTVFFPTQNKPTLLIFGFQLKTNCHIWKRGPENGTAYIVTYSLRSHSIFLSTTAKKYIQIHKSATPIFPQHCLIVGSVEQ